MTSYANRANNRDPRTESVELTTFQQFWFNSFRIQELEMQTTLYNALIRTHHITSRKKVSALKRAADTYNCFVLLRSGGCPGIMYVESKEKDSVESWVNTVRNLRYKDFQLVTRPDVMTDEKGTSNGGRIELSRSKKKNEETSKAGLYEVETVKEFGGLMEQRGVWQWWRKGMGYTS